MSKHGAEAHLPISELAQWMRDTTGRPDDGTRGGLVVHEVTIRRDYLHHPPYPVAEGAAFTPPPMDGPGTLTVDDVLRIAEIDKKRLLQAGLDAVRSYRDEGHTDAEIALHAERIWALYDQILEAAQ
jgi:hypothetical protein